LSSHLGEVDLLRRALFWCRYSKVASLFESDPRWVALGEDENEREELYEEYACSSRPS
jgi:hypothetical protein